MSSSCSIAQLAPSIKINYSVPDNFLDSDKKLFYDLNFSNTIHAINMYLIEDGIISNKYVFNGTKLEYQFTNHKKVSFKIYLKSLIKKYIKPKVRIDAAILGIQEWDNNFYHWMTETLPLIIAMYKLKKCPVLLNSNSLIIKHITNSLSLLKIPYTIHNHSNKTAVISKLYLTKVPKVDTCNEILIKQMKNIFFDTLKISEKDKQDRKLYISRKKSQKRKISNEIEVEKFLEELEFECVYLEDYSLENQIKILSQSKIVISPHGAGLTNIMFMKEGSTVIELKAKNNDYWCFFSLARLSNLKYYYLLCDSNEINHRKADINVDLLKLKELLKQHCNL